MVALNGCGGRSNRVPLEAGFIMSQLVILTFQSLENKQKQEKKEKKKGRKRKPKWRKTEQLVERG